MSTAVRRFHAWPLAFAGMMFAAPLVAQLPEPTLTVTNRSDKPMQVVWLKPDGTERVYRELKPGETYRQPTVAGHNWAIREAATGAVAQRVTAIAGSLTVEVTAPRPPAVRPPAGKPAGRVPANITFANRTQGIVQLIWRQPDGTETVYRELTAGEQCVQSTFVGDRWLLKDKATGQIYQDVTAGAPAAPNAPPAVPNVPPAAGVGGSNLTAAEVEVYVKYHNRVRAEVGVGAVAWSPELAKFAQQRAEEIAQSGVIAHRRHQYGENLAWAGGRLAPAVVKTGLDGWYGEKAFFTPGTPIPGGAAFADFKSGHYTAMVWKNTAKVGAGKAVIQTGPNQGQQVIVGIYDPPGNMIGQPPY